MKLENIQLMSQQMSSARREITPAENFTSLRSSNCNIHLTSNLSIISGYLPVIKSMMRNNCKI